MLMNNGTKNVLTKLSKKCFAGGKQKSIDPSLREFDVVFLGGLISANMVKLFQKKHFHGTMAAFSARNKFFHEHLYEYLIGTNMKEYKYLSMPIASNFNNQVSKCFRERVTKINPANNELILEKGETIKYKALMLNTGLDQHVHTMPFLKDLVKDEYAKTRVFVHESGNSQILNRNFRIFQMHKDGDFILYLPSFPSRREAYDHWYLALDTFFTRGLISEVHSRGFRVRVITPNNTFPFANEVVNEEIRTRSTIEVHYGWELTNVESNPTIHGNDRFAYFRDVKTGEEIRLRFGSLLLTPENKKRSIYEGNDLADEHGQVTVNPYTLQHTKYPNVFACGDCVNVPTTKGLYAALNQSVVVRNNLWSYLHGEDMRAIYEGYSAFRVHHSMDRVWLFKHYYNYVPTAFNFYVPRFLGFVAYKLLNSLERNYLSKVFQQKENFGYPYLQKDRYFRPVNENKFLLKNKITLEQLFPHKYEKPVLSFEHEHGHDHHGSHAPAHH